MSPIAATTIISSEKGQRDLVKDLAEAVSTQAEVANRMWLALITVAVFALIPHAPTANGTVELPFGLGGVSPVWYHGLIFSILVVLSLAFAAAHAQQIRAQKLAQSVINSSTANSMSGSLHPRDYFDMLRKPSLTRVASLAQVLRGERQFFTSTEEPRPWLQRVTAAYYGLLKLVSMIIYFFLPICALSYAWLQVLGVGRMLWWCKTAGGLVAIVALLEVLTLDAVYAVNIMKLLWRLPKEKSA